MKQVRHGDIKRAHDEKIDSFLHRFETLESQMKNSAVEIPNLILALQLFESVDVKSDQIQNIFVRVNMDNADTVYDEMKSSIRLMKGILVEEESKSLNVSFEGEKPNFDFCTSGQLVFLECALYFHDGTLVL